MGKGLIAKNALSFIFERHYFNGGVIYINMQGITHIEQMYVKIHHVFLYEL